MKPYDFAVARDVPDALAQATSGSAYLAGGTTLVDLMKLEVMTPQRVVDINSLPLRGITRDGEGLHIGALERMSDVAAHPWVATGYPMLAGALRGASPQLRNMATVGGNLLQRSRCNYFRDTSTPCNKRQPGSGCPAVNGMNRGHAILGTSDSCVSTHPSDLAVALVALDASVVTSSRSGGTRMRLVDLYLKPGNTPHLENRLQPGELITKIIVPALPWATRSAYLKVQDRRLFQFALTSAAVAADIHDVVRDIRIAVGGVGTVPWRLQQVEDAIRGRPMRRDIVEAAAAKAVQGVRPLAHNRFKVALLQRTIVRALMGLVG
jgi:xanthine dehydrogenase YagS FAD-binding subunit